MPLHSGCRRRTRRAQPRLGDDVRRGDQDGHLRPGADQRLLRDPPLAWGVAVLGAGRPGRLLRRGLRARPARPQAAARVPQHREHRHHPDGAGAGDDRALHRAGRLGGPGDGRLPVPRLEPRASSSRCSSSAPGAVVHATGSREIERMGGLRAAHAGDRRRSSWSARWRSAACRRSTASPASCWSTSAWSRGAVARGDGLGGAAGAGAGGHRRAGRGLLREGRRDRLPAASHGPQRRARRTNRRRACWRRWGCWRAAACCSVWPRVCSSRRSSG